MRDRSTELGASRSSMARTVDRDRAVTNVTRSLGSLPGARAQAKICRPVCYGPAMPLFTARGLHKSYGASVLLDDGELHIGRGERIGLVGLNGSGKSTLLRILAGLETAESGEMAWRNGIRVVYLPQAPELDESMTLLQVAMHGATQAAGSTASGMQPYEREVQAVRKLSELGVPDPDITVAQASGGTRRRAAIAAALLQAPDVLLLDEPTNHLDTRTVEWLERTLCGFGGALVLVTHDRYFLNTVVDRIVELRRGTLFSWPGTFEDYLAGRLDQEHLEARTEHNRKRRFAAELDWLRRSPKARSTKQKARIQRAEAIRHTDYQPEKEVKLVVNQGRRLGKRILDCVKVDVGFAGHAPLVQGLQLAMTRGMRVGVVGDNGVGKTTLVRTLIGEHPPLSGDVTLGINTQALHIDQQRSGLDPDATVRESATPAGGDWVQLGEGDKRGKQHVASWLEQFLFRGDDLRQKVSTLSGGQRFRLLLAKRLQEPMNLLVLDEPTNDLDFETLSVLEDALVSYPGCLMVVSHDRAFMDRVCTHVLELSGGGDWLLHVGNWSEWQARSRSDRANAPKKARKRAEVAVDDDAPPKPTWAEQRRLEVIEAEIEAAELAVDRAQAALADPRVAGDYSKLAPASAALQDVTERRDALYWEWQQLEDKQATWAAFKTGDAAG